MKTVRILTSLASFVIAGLLQISPALAAGPPAAAGDNPFGGRLEVTFIKWVTNATAGTMAGVVSGDVGGGQFVGQVLAPLSQDGDILTIHASYQIIGSAYNGAYNFTANNVVTQDMSKGTAVINGTVISPGPLNGARVQGEYQVIYPCGITNAVEIGSLFSDVCFQGNLVVRPGLAR